MDLLEPITTASLASVVWPLCRVSAFFMSMLIIGGSTVPTMVRALLSLAFTLCVLPSLPFVPADIEPFSGLGLIITLKECLIGAAIGFMTNFVTQTFMIAGQAVAMQTGLGFASLVDPVSGTNSPVVGQFFSVLCTLVFLSVNGHMIFIRLMLLSFETVPVDGGFFLPDSLAQVAFFGALMFQAALSMAISAICCMLTINFTLGVMTRAAPQLNIFSLGFAFTLSVGLLVLTTNLNAFLVNFNNNFNALSATTCTLINVSCDGFL